MKMPNCEGSHHRISLISGQRREIFKGTEETQKESLLSV